MAPDRNQLPKTTQRIDLRLTSEPNRVAGARYAIESFAADMGMDERGIGEVGLCLNEAMANVIHHAYDDEPGKPIMVSAWRKDQTLHLEIRDWGNGLNPDAANRRKEHDPLTPGGLGLICLRKLMDQVEYRPQEPGMLLVMTKRLSPLSPARTDGECSCR